MTFDAILSDLIGIKANFGLISMAFVMQKVEGMFMKLHVTTEPDCKKHYRIVV